MQRLYTLEYSEDQGCFHYNDGKHQKNTNTYETIRENCTYRYLSIFNLYIENKYGAEDLTIDLLKKSVDELDVLIDSITQLNLELNQQ